MLAKCSNPSCSALFRYLTEGRLYRLESDPALRTSGSSPAEYFWLCGFCSSTMTLCLDEDRRVVAVSLPKPIHSVPDGVALMLADRKKGLVLRSISSPLSEDVQDQRRARLTGGQHAA
jgi:hypothetical protein